MIDKPNQKQMDELNEICEKKYNEIIKIIVKTYEEFKRLNIEESVVLTCICTLTKQVAIAGYGTVLCLLTDNGQQKLIEEIILQLEKGVREKMALFSEFKNKGNQHAH